MNEPGSQRLLRNALRAEITQRLRPALMHGLKSPAQTILSALHLLQKKAAPGAQPELDRYAQWIKNGVEELIERAQRLLPASPASEPRTCDLAALTYAATHLLRDEAALKQVEWDLTALGEGSVRGHESDLLLALQAVLIGALDGAPSGGAVRVALTSTATRVGWFVQVPGDHTPSPEVLTPQYEPLLQGSGIGWSVARGIVEEHGGSLTLESEKDTWLIHLRFPSV